LDGRSSWAVVAGGATARSQGSRLLQQEMSGMWRLNLKRASGADTLGASTAAETERSVGSVIAQRNKPVRPLRLILSDRRNDCVPADGWPWDSTKQAMHGCLATATGSGRRTGAGGVAPDRVALRPALLSHGGPGRAGARPPPVGPNVYIVMRALITIICTVCLQPARLPLSDAGGRLAQGAKREAALPPSSAC
jgi:hypothetical protein